MNMDLEMGSIQAADACIASKGGGLPVLRGEYFFKVDEVKRMNILSPNGLID